MPKVLSDIQKRILSTAETHFDQFGFEKTEMRDIAKELDISVGTIYLHFQNKQELFRQVIFQDWQKTESKLQELSQSEKSASVIFRSMLEELARDMAKKRSHYSLWIEIGVLHHQFFAQENITAQYPVMNESASESFGRIITRLAAEGLKDLAPSICRQLGSFTFIMIVEACIKDPQNIEEQIDLIEKIILSYLQLANEDRVITVNIRK